jgi:hypothetical protein
MHLSITLYEESSQYLEEEDVEFLKCIVGTEVNQKCKTKLTQR